VEKERDSDRVRACRGIPSCHAGYLSGGIEPLPELLHELFPELLHELLHEFLLSIKSVSFLLNELKKYI